ncbi:MAG: PQQ-binding-like beta-propeller repeat protein [Planctomycetales bacterium]|nr:PQQ-binding-like beta-propeller repeat protein [Planctomycetales bacterium]
MKTNRRSCREVSHRPSLSRPRGAGGLLFIIGVFVSGVALTSVVGCGGGGEPASVSEAVPASTARDATADTETHADAAGSTQNESANEPTGDVSVAVGRQAPEDSGSHATLGQATESDPVRAGGDRRSEAPSAESGSTTVRPRTGDGAPGDPISVTAGDDSSGREAVVGSSTESSTGPAAISVRDVAPPPVNYFGPPPPEAVPPLPGDPVGVEVGGGADKEPRGPKSWPMALGNWQRTGQRINGPFRIDFDPNNDADVAWKRQLGTETYGNPVVVDGRLLIATNNAGGFRPAHPPREDRGVLLCFDAHSGDFQWQLTRTKLAGGFPVDVPNLGICSTPCVTDGLAYLVTNRCELICLDMEGFADGENDGPYVDEADHELGDADIVWLLDMRTELGVHPHNVTACNPLVFGDLVYTVTGNGLDEGHSSIPAPKAPSFLAVNRHTGEVAWSSDVPSKRVLHGLWGSPALSVIGGQTIVIFPGGDGWLYGFEAQSGEELWRCDLNPKGSQWKAGGGGDRCPIVATPVIVGDDVVVGVGDDPEMGDGVGHLYRIRATGRGDVSPEIETEGGEVVPNANSAVVWHYGGIDSDGSITGEANSPVFRRTISAVAVAEGMVFAPDLSGYLHCIDWETGERHWEADLMSGIWTTPLVVDRWVMFGNEYGELSFFALDPNTSERAAAVEFDRALFTNPAVVGDLLYQADRQTIYAIRIRPE